jgi:hypothetical protein
MPLILDFKEFMGYELKKEIFLLLPKKRQGRFHGTG